MSATSRVIPSGYQVAQLRLDGESPLLMNSAEFDRDGDTYRAFRNLGSKRGKSLEDEARLRELEFHLALYYDAEVGVYVPGANVKELIRQAATKWRKGEEVRRSLIVPAYRIPLTYDGPREPHELYDAGYRDTRMVANAGAGSGRVARTRPMFAAWAVDTEIAWDPEDLDRDLVESAIERARKYGFGDGRTIGFGAFTPTIKLLRVQRANSSADAIDPRNGAHEAGHNAARKRVMIES